MKKHLSKRIQSLKSTTEFTPKSFALRAIISCSALLTPFLFAHRASAACLNPDPFVIGAGGQPDQTSTLTNSGSCTLGTFQIDSTYSLSVSNGDGLDNSATITTLTNSGTISTTGDYAYGISNEVTITTLTNSGTISATGTGSYGIFNQGVSITTLTNSGTISTTGNNSYGIVNGGTITTLTNSGTISTTSNNSYGIVNGGTITTLTNTGTISTTGNNSYGIFNNSDTGTIITLNNLQGKANSPLTYYYGTLPTNYNIIINSPSNYGQLSVTSATGTMAFGVYNTSTVANGTYTGVLQGFGNTLSTYISSGTTGNFNGYTWSFAEEGNTGTWDLVFGNGGSGSGGSGSGSGGGSSTVINDTASSIHTQSYAGTVTSATWGSGGTFIATGGPVAPLQVQGPLTLNSGSNLIIAPIRGSYGLGSTNYVITANSVTGTFSNVSSTFSLYPYQVGYTDTGVTVTYQPYTVPNQNTAASAVDNSVGLYNLFSNLPIGQDLINALNSISAEPYADNQTVGLQFLRRQSDLLLGSAGDNCQDAKKNYCGFVLGGKNVGSINGQNGLASFNSAVVTWSSLRLWYY